jgi:ribonuclease P protein component
LRRLKRRQDFLRVAGIGRKWAAPGLVLQCAPAGEPRGADQAGGPAVGFTASRRVGGAVARNRARRRLRAVAEQVIGASARADLDYVLIARAATLGRRFDLLARDLRAALGKLGALAEQRPG